MTRYAKLITAVVGAVATWAATYYPTSAAVQQWVGLALALATAFSVWAVPNTPPRGKPRRADISEQGESLVGLLVVVVLVLLIVWLVLALAGR